MEDPGVRSTALGRFVWPHVALGLFLVLWLNSGVSAVGLDVLPGSVKIALVGAWLAFSAARSSEFTSRLILTTWPLLLMLAIIVLLPTSLYGEQTVQGLGYVAIATALWSFYGQMEYRDERMLVLGVALIDLGVTGVRTFAALRDDPLLSRYLATTEENRTQVYGDQSFAGLGGYSFTYALAALLLVILFSASCRRRGWLLALPLIGVGLALLLSLAFATAIVLFVVIAIIFVIHDLNRNQGLRLMVYGALVMGWFSGFYAWLAVRVAGSSLVAQEVAIRLVEVAAFLEGNAGMTHDLSSRIDYWNVSLNQIMTHGPFGVLGGSVGERGIGGHSAWLDLAAGYGIVAGLFFIFLALGLRRQIADLEPRDIAVLKRTWIYFVVLGSVNTLLFSTIVLAWMFLVPALIDGLNRRGPRLGGTVEPKRAVRSVIER